MTPEEYKMTQTQLLAMAPIIADMDLDDFLRDIERAEAFGCFKDPTLWMKGIDNLQKIKEIAKGALEFKKAVLKVRVEEDGNAL